MSEYQYYEFQAIDRPLTPEEQQAVSRLSSRVDPHPRRALFIYHYSDFPGRAKDVLAKYYDAMFYIANWGSVRLAFRLPKSLVDVQDIEPYCIEDAVTIEEVGDYVVVHMEVNDEEGFGWTEGEGYLDSLLPLRDDILRRDYRVLYLAWLAALKTVWGIDEEMREPPLPPGLKKLSPALLSFIDAFSIDQHLVTAAAKASQEPTKIAETDVRQVIARLSREECEAWLLRLAQDEAHLGLAFQRHLQGSTASTTAEPGQRTVSELLSMAEAEEVKARNRQVAEAEAQRIRELEALAPKAEETWTFAEQLITQSNARAYDEAVQLLVKLRDLAVHQGKEAAYERRLRGIREEYQRRRALLQRFDRAGLP
jgi:hypothetical protein